MTRTYVHGSSKALVRTVDEDYTAMAQSVIFDHSPIDHTGSEMVAAFPDIEGFTCMWTPHPLPVQFVRELGLGYEDTLCFLDLTGCGLVELPCQLGLLRNLERLTLTDNDLLWVHHTLANTFWALSLLGTENNPRLPQSLCGYFGNNRAQPVFNQLCALDADNRSSLYAWLWVLSKRLPLTLGRDMVQLLGRELWRLRWLIEHKK
jgi:hypothetical protein